MPLYEYRCPQCNYRFEKLRRMQDADRDIQCPQCRCEQVERQLSTFAAGGCAPSGSGRFT